MGFGERAEALLAGLQRFLHRLACGDVDIEAADVADAAVRTAHGKTDHQIPGIAVEVRQTFLAHQHPAGGQHLLIALGDESRVVTDRALGDGVAEHALDVGGQHLAHFGIEQNVAALEILQIHADRRVLHERGEAGLALLQGLLHRLELGDVGDRGQHRRAGRRK